MTRASGDGSLIAVVGISCRLPHAPDSQAYWQLLRSGGEAISELPRERWELAGEDLGSTLEEEPGTRLGGFLEGVDRFDPAFFGIAPREAAAMDPQQRLALELAWEALEDAGIAPSAIRGDAAGVFLGAIAGDYASLADRRGPEAIDRHTVTGLHRAIIANRVSYVLGLGGPSLTVDAAQSASLVAVHLACESLRRGESRLALAGGVHLNLDPRGALGAARIGGLSPDGRCFTFDARANGFVRGEGGGLVVLKPLAEARADGDHVYCVVRGSAVNNDGGGASLTAPSQIAQEAVLGAAYRRAGVKRSEVQYVELHGSGTPVGDPIEAAALGGVLGAGRSGPARLPVGSAKTNIGHLEGAAGIAGLIKVALAIDRREIPPSLNFEQPNPAIPLDQLGLRVQGELGRWPHAERPLLAGVSSFGVGGTNCHVVLSETVPGNQKKSSKTKNTSDPEAVAAPLGGAAPILLSAASRPALRAQAERLGSHLEGNAELPLADLGSSLATTRSHLRQRAAIMAADRAQLSSGLAALAAGAESDGVVTGSAQAESSPVFLFPGQGSQWVGMGVELAESSPAFRGYLEECEAALAPHIDFSVRDTLVGAKGAASLDRVDVIQPALFAVMVSLAKFWRHCGVTPAAVVGHSQGEVAAAYVAGAFSLEDAALVAAVRSRLIQERAGQGGMVSVALSARSLEPLLAPFGDRLAIAAQNGPAAVIVSGERAALDELLEACAAREVWARDVAGGIFPSHSPFVEPMRDEVIEGLAGIVPRQGSIPFHSTVTGGLLDTRELGAEYWFRNLRQPVRFEAVTRQLLDQGHRVFVEVSAHPVFAVAVEETIEDVLGDPEGATVLATLRRDQGGPERFARSLAEAHVAGATVDWAAHFPVAKRVKLPTYPFQRQPYWLGDASDDSAGDPAVATTADSVEGLAAELADLPERERERRMFALVRDEVAKLLGQGSGAEVVPDRTFKDLGFDSAAAADLRKRLRVASGLPIGSTAVFDHPTAAALSRHLLALGRGEALGEPAGNAVVRARGSDEPVAIVGMAARFPGASSPLGLWQLLEGAIDATSEFPADRGWDRGRLYDPDSKRPNTTYTNRGGFLADAGHFDPEFFGISPREATAMDPQQRLLLEASWEALERAGIDPGELRGAPAGVFTGISSQDYTAGLRASGDSAEGYRLTGSATSVASGRVSYALGLEGPAITVDTACSSSLVATHLAAGALRGGECSLALAGGATVLGSPGVFTEFSRQRGLAPDGRCKSFAEGADGTAWSEGAGVLVLERLSDAEANGHRVWATIKGSAVNQDGASNGLTAPNGPSQERVIRQALANAGLKAADVDMVEAHGTGTALGDPIEAGALLATYGQERETPLKLGSLKSNIGHAQAAAGVAGVIKAVMAMREGVMPKTLHLDAPSSKVEWESGKVELLSEAMPWPEGERPRRAAVSSFGISGTNAHLILEEAPVAGRDPGPGASSKDQEGETTLSGPVPFLLSARSPEALTAQATRLGAHLRGNPDQAPTDLAFSLATTRAQLEHRAVVVGSEHDELLTALEALAQGESPPGTLQSKATPGARLACLFTGQGSQRAGMGKELYETYPAYAQAFEEACAEIDPLIGRSLEQLVFCEPGSEEAELLAHTTYAQPALFATGAALHRLYESFGLAPELMAGHSIGEITAAHLSGVFSLPDAAKLVCARGALMGALPSGGAMLAIEATEAEVSASIEGQEEKLSLAAVNSPSACVASGTEQAIEELQAHWQEQGRKTKRLDVSHAFHSPLMEPMLAEFAQVAATLDYGEPQVPIVSCLSGEPLTPGQATDPTYWVSHVREPVRFADAVETLAAEGACAFVELGPDPVLCAMARECLQGEPTLAPALRQGRPEPESALGALAAAHASGAPVDWDTFFAGSGAKAVPLPTYPFQRKRYWLNPASAASDPAALGQRPLEHPFLAAAIEEPEGEGIAFAGRVSLSEHPWLADHAVLGTALLPGTAFLELALFAGAESGTPAVEELTLEAPLLLSEGNGVALRVSLSAPDEQGRREIAIHSRPEGEDEGWTRNASGTLGPEAPTAPEPLTQWPPAAAEPLDLGDLRARLAEAGFEYGAAFGGLTAAWREGTDIYAELSLPEGLEPGGFGVHPALLDACLHPVALGAGEGVRLPFSWSGASLLGSGVGELRVRVSAGGEGASLALAIAGGEGAPLGRASLSLREVDPAQLETPGQSSDGLFEVEWRQLELPGLNAGPAAELLELVPPATVDRAKVAQELCANLLRTVQEWLGESEQGVLAILTRGAVATDSRELPDTALAAAWGLVRSAQAEHPGRFLLIDSDGSEASEAALEQALASDPRETQLALREGVLLAPRLGAVSGLVPPPAPWRLGLLAGKEGTLDGLSLLPAPEAERPLGPGEVRIEMRAAGVNFRDVLMALGLYPDGVALGSEGAGIVTEVGSRVADLAPGDRVMGMVGDAFAPLAVAERELLVPLPDRWGFGQGAAVPSVFLTALHALDDLAGLKAGEKVLIHAGAGGVGMAAIGIARHRGAEVFATASRSKWDALRQLGLADDRIASSRDLDFKRQFLEATEGNGVDVVLNSLTGEFVGASLELLAGGGCFLEMGKTDIRDAGEIAEAHPGVSYHPFDLTDVGGARIGEMLAEVRGLLERGELSHSPIASWDLRQAAAAFRHLREGRNVGKVVLTTPPSLDPERTVLITGATGGLGALVAKHLVEAHGARRLLLVSRSGEDAPGALDLRAQLQEAGAEAWVAACDVSDRGQLEALLGSIPTGHPLGAVIHCAAVLDDATVEAASEEQLERVFAAKADAAWHLHELTADLDLSHFVCFSSIAGIIGSPGQGAYAAANCFLDGLAAQRRAEGLPATSIAWGLWQRESGMASQLGDADLARMRRTGIEALSEQQGLALFDAALASSQPLSVAVRFDRTALRAQAIAGTLPSLFAKLAPGQARRAASSAAARLAAVPEAEREAQVLELVRSEVASVLDHESADAIDPDRVFKDLGFDSLAAVELRNRLETSTGLRLASTTVFDHPTATALAAHLLTEMTSDGRVKQAVARVAQSSEEPIAIVGMGCHLPGGVDSPEQLWELVAEGRDGIVPFPADRGWDLERIYDPDPAHAGTSYVREGGFLADPAAFDAEFFGIAPREATAMDPQQRLLLETSWEALEDAGIDPRELKGEPAGVFAGAAKGDYSSAVEGYKMIGGLASVLAGRISYTLGLEGPALSVDTACSSSLVAMHLAIAALHRGECSLALAGGVTVHATPAMFVDFSRQRVLAADGRSKSFAAGADGAGWSEGVGMLVLERLSEAERNGRRVFATIRGSAVNQDGASNGLSAPNGPSQERVIRQALANAGLAPADVDAVEAHGTGTALGDPLEAGALIATYGRERERPLKLGSIKSNIGHTLGAAGVAGVIKMTMAMRAGVLPKTLHADSPSPAVEWDSAGVELLKEPVAWEPAARPRRAAVSSFGISGTNAHLILEEAPATAPAGPLPGVEGTGPAASRQPLPDTAPLVLSARTEPALRAQAERLASHLRKSPDLGLADVAYSLASRRASFEQRAVVAGGSREEALAALDSLAGGALDSPSIARGTAGRDAKVAFLFPGQGSQWQGMALELLDSSPVFADSMGECEEALAPHLDFVLGDVLAGVAGAPSIERIEVVQPALFAVMVSLARLWRACGVVPAAAAGHSQGEIAAAHLAGGLSLEDAAQLAAVRSRLISKLAGKGGMVSLIMPGERVEDLIEPWRGTIEVAALNGPSSTIVSGTREALDELLALCAEREGVRAREVPAAIASHSHHVEALRDEVLEAFAGLSPRSGSIPFYSTVTGGPLDTAELGAEYWYRNLRQPVLFERVARGLIEAGHGSLIEVSPHPVFTLAVGETIERTAAEHGKATVIETLRREEGGARRFAMSLAQAHAAGAPVDWDAFFTGSGAKAVPLPTYPFQRKRYWLNPASTASDPAALGQRALEHPFLAAAIEEPEGEGIAFSGRVSLSEHPWLADHAVFGTALLPGTAFLELALFSGRRLSAPTVAELTLRAPLPLSEVAVALRVSVSAPDSEGRREITIHSRPEGDEEGDWTRNATGVLAVEALAVPDPLPQWPPQGAKPVGPDDLHARLAEAGFEYGEAFQGLTAVWRAGEDLYAEVSLPAELGEGAGSFSVHPALLDACLHPVALGAGEGVRLPFSWSGVSLSAGGARELRVKISGGSEEGASLALFDASGAAVGQIDSLLARPPSAEQMRGVARAPLYGLRWEPFARSRQALPPAEPWRAPRPGQAADSASEATTATLEKIQQWLATEPEDSRLAILAEGAVATREGESPDPATAALWGLVRSAASEHPGRFLLIDSDGSEASEAALERALAADPHETQLALREGELLVPRLAAAKSEEAETAPLDPERTVLITGGTGALGGLITHHLAEAHGARRLLLASRSGEWARGGAGLRTQLEELGAEVTVAACDVSDHGQLEALLGSIPAEHPLGAVIHCAGILDDATIQAASAGQLERVFAAKADAARHLHELTAGLELSHFICFSSIAGIIGSPGQGAYAAANCFLDGLAAQRRAEGLPATSIAWGLWERESGMAGQLGDADLARMRRAGVEALSEQQGLDLFDAALLSSRPLVAAVRFDRAALRAQAGEGGLPALLAGMVPASGGTGAASTGALSRRLAETPEVGRGRLAEDFVRAEVAAILGHASAGAVGPNDAFKDLGFDSLAAVELRNRLNLATGLLLPATVVFDYPDAEALSQRILAAISGSEAARSAPARALSSEEPVAIVGMACRYPGGVSSPAELWRLVEAERDAIAELPADRGWDPASIYVLDPGRPELDYSRAGGFLADAADFDPGFFGISPREAVSIDPQQRLALESSWEALEDAGIDPQRLRGSATGVFAGVMHHDYGIARDDSSGMAAGAASGRVSYALGLEGPAITVDTACSSSLVATHLAAGALRGGECDLALAGGSTVLATPAVFGYFSRQQGLARDGRCKAFSEAADGVGISEGVGLLVLERLSDAEANGHRVWATIKGSAVNQDGASNGLTAPNGPSQERVIRQALANAGLKAADVDMVEAHGTGTALGDPIEAGALLATYGQERETPIKLGSLKSNIGHAQAAAGVAGVIKAVMAMREGVMPKTLHLDAPSSKVEWESGKVELLSEAVEWEANGQPRRAGVSSFGASGTNAHLILEEAPKGLAGGDWEVGEPTASSGASAKDPEGGEGTPPAPLSGPVPFTLSAKSPEALAAQATRLATHLRDNPDEAPTDLAFSLATTRAQLEHRAVVVGSEHDELLTALRALAQGESPPGTLQSRATPGARLACLFTGQGSQRAGMGKELYETYPAYAQAFEEACAEIDPLIGRSLEQLVFCEPGSEEAELLAHTTYAQPALFATGAALHRLYESFGLAPELMAGHSIGEITAAHLSGVFSLPDAAKLVCARGALMGALPSGGAMLAIEATEAEVSASIEGQEEKLSLAAVNSPSACVASGTEQAIEELQAHWRDAGKKTKRLDVSHAFHSPLMEPMLAEFAQVAATLDYGEPQTPIVSCLSGEPLTPGQATDPTYWVSHVREPVRFSDAVATLAAEGACAFVELGPDPVLCAMARECLQGEPTLAPALRQGRPEPESALGALAAAHASGASVDWDTFFAGSGAKAVPLPTYPFQRKRYWLNPASAASDPAALGQRPLEHPFLAAAIEEPEGEGIAFAGRVSLAEHPWLADHAVLGTALLPGTAFLELALFAGAESGTPSVEELTLEAPLLLSEGNGVALRVSLSAPDEQGRREIAIHSRPEGEDEGWTRNASGTLGPEAPTAPEPLTQWPPAAAEPLDLDDLRARLAEAGFEYGAAFQGLGAAWREGTDIYAELSLPEGLEPGGFGVHPALLDACLHPVALGAGEGVRLPFSWSGASLLGSGVGELRVRVSGGGEEGARIELFDGAGTPVGQVDSLIGRPLDPERMRVAQPPLYGLAWQRRPLAGSTPSTAQLWRVPAADDGAAAVSAATLAVLEKIQDWLASEPEDTRLAILTEGAVATSEAESADPAQAALWGLVRSAASEHPGRFSLIDSDGGEASEAALEQALAGDPRETQLALREGELLVPRLSAVKDEGETEPTELDPDRTVLITGASGGLGALIAQHLVEAHGARHLLLVSRSGEEAPGALDLRALLEEAGAGVRVAACDVSDRGQLEELLGEIPAEQPLGAVIHCAAVLDDGLIESLDPERLQRVFAAKADAAWHLHELTADLDLSHFVCFSSIAGIVGSPGQGSYAAANCFLDALAAQRRAGGLPSTSIAWGLWQRESGMASQLGEADLARMRRAGIAALSEQQGLDLFDAALASKRAVVAAVRFDRAALRAQAGAGGLPALLEGMVPASARASAASTEALSRRLAEAPEAARGRLAEDFVRAEVAAILGHASAGAIAPSDAFKDLGFDSLAAIELRNRLGAAVGRRLAASIVFDYPTAAALAAHLLEEAGEVEPGSPPELARLEQSLAGMSGDDPARAKLASRLRALAAELEGGARSNGDSVSAQLEGASDEELLEFIDTQVGADRG